YQVTRLTYRKERKDKPRATFMAQPTPIRRDSPEFLSPAEPPARTARLSPLQIACGLSVGLFLLLKFPLLFAERHWEELRDLAALLEVAQGNLPHRDFYWH